MTPCPFPTTITITPRAPSLGPAIYSQSELQSNVIYLLEESNVYRNRNDPQQESRMIINRYGVNLPRYKTPATLSKKSVSSSCEGTIAFAFFVKHHYCGNSFLGKIICL